MLFFRAVRRRHARNRADLIEAIACGYSGVKSDKGRSFMQKMLAKLQV